MTREQQPEAQGDLVRYPFPRLLYVLYKKQFLGELAISRPRDGIEGTIYFRDGLPVFTDMPFSIDVLGRVLVERGLIREEQMYESLQHLSAGDQLQGQILIQLGALDMGGLIEGLRTQLVRKLNRTFTLRDASFAIYSGEHGRGMRGEEAQVRADPLWVIYHGVRNSFDAAQLEPELQKLHEMAIRLPPAFEDIWPRYGMGEEVNPLVTLLTRGAVPLERLFSLSNLGQLPTQMLIYALWVTEALEAIPARRPARASTGAMPPAQANPIRRTPSQAGPPLRQTPSQVNTPIRRTRSGELSEPGSAPRANAPRASAPHTPPPARRHEPAPAVAQAEADAIPLLDNSMQPDSVQQRPARETAPEVRALAAAFTSELSPDPVETLDDNDLIGSLEPDDDQDETTDGGTPIITSAPVWNAGGSTAPELGQEGVYTIPHTRRAPRESATPAAEASQPIANIPSSPGLSRVPSSPGMPIIDAGTTAKHYQLIRKTFKRIAEGENYYQVLEVDPKASPDQIREAYFSMAKDFHPDRVSSLGLKDVAKEAEEIFRFINDGHTTLTSPESRAAYDESLKGGDKKLEVHDALTAEFAFQKGLVHFRKKDFPEALRHFQESFRLNPKEGEHLAYIAWTLYSDPKGDRRNLLPKIKEQLLKSIRVSPHSATCYHFLGEVYLALGEERRAFTCFDKVLDIQPDHLEATRHMRIIRMRKEKQKEKSSGLFSRFTKKKKK